MRIEWLILADFAEVINNKLYLQGGSWNTLTVNTGFPAEQRVGIAASVIVPWNETNQQENLQIEVQSDDGAVLGKVGGGFKVGRPPDHPPGQDQRVQIAANITLKLRDRGTYAIIGRLGGEEEARTQFNVVKGPVLMMREQAAGSDQPKAGQE